MKTYTVSYFDHKHEFYLRAKRYNGNNALCVEAVHVKDNTPFEELTINLPESDTCAPDRAYINIQGCPWAAEFLIAEGIAKYTGNNAIKNADGLFFFYQGCNSPTFSYPEFKFDLSKMEKISDNEEVDQAKKYALERFTNGTESEKATMMANAINLIGTFIDLAGDVFNCLQDTSSALAGFINKISIVCENNINADIVSKIAPIIADIRKQYNELSKKKQELYTKFPGLDEK